MQTRTDNCAYTCWTLEFSSTNGEKWGRYNADIIPYDLKKPLNDGWQKTGDNVFLEEKIAIDTAFHLKNIQPKFMFRIRRVEVKVEAVTVVTFE